MKSLFALLLLSSFTVVSELEVDNGMIVFIENETGEQRVIKQIKNRTPDEQFLLVIDATACAIAEEMKIPVNTIQIIPPEAPYPGKKFLDLPATLHSLAPGKSAEKKLPWQGFDLHQRYRKENSPRWNEWGPLPPENTGLSRKVLLTMAGHPSLIAIAALDTYTGNADRSNPNIFYDESSNSFCGIDMADAFHSPIAAFTCDQMERFLTSQLTPSEISALGQYRRELHKLLVNFPAEKICKLLDKYARQAGFHPGSPLFTQDVQDRIHHHKKIILQNCQDAQRLWCIMNSSEFLDLLEQ